MFSLIDNIILNFNPVAPSNIIRTINGSLRIAVKCPSQGPARIYDNELAMIAEL